MTFYIGLNYFSRIDRDVASVNSDPVAHEELGLGSMRIFFITKIKIHVGLKLCLSFYTATVIFFK